MSDGGRFFFSEVGVGWQERPRALIIWMDPLSHLTIDLLYYTYIYASSFFFMAFFPLYCGVGHSRYVLSFIYEATVLVETASRLAAQLGAGRFLLKVRGQDRSRAFDT